MAVISMLAYTHHQTHNLMQKLFAIYFKFHGLSAQALDTLHDLGLVMPMKWTTNCVSELAGDSKQEMLSFLNNRFWIMSHDNVNIAFKVYPQRVNKQTHFDSGTAATVFMKPNVGLIPEELAENLCERIAAGMKTPLTSRELMDIDTKSTQNLRPHLIHKILKTLLALPEFNLKTYRYRESTILNGPNPICHLPSGPEHRAIQYLLGTVKIEEASYEGNNQLIHEWLHQLGLHSWTERMKTGEKRLIFFIGDQLTVSRFTGLQKM